MHTLHEEVDMLHRCFDGEAAAQLDSVTLDYAMPLAGPVQFEYRNRIESGDPPPRLMLRVRSDLDPVLARAHAARFSTTGADVLASDSGASVCARGGG